MDDGLEMSSIDKGAGNDAGLDVSMGEARYKHEARVKDV